MDKKRSLKWFLILSLVLAMAIPLIFTGAIFTRILANSMKNQIVSANESLSDSFIDQIEAYLDHALDDLRTLRTMVEKQDFEMIHLTSLLDSIRKNKDYFTKIQIINKQGFTRYLSPHEREYINLDMSWNKMFIEPIRTGQPYWSPTFISPESNTPVVSLSIPFENGVMVGFLSLEELARAARKIAHGKPIYITITDQTSSYIAHYRDEFVFQRGFDPNYTLFKDQYKGNIISRVMDQGGESMLATAALISKTNWAIVFFQPVKKVFEPIRLLYLYMGTGLVFLIIVTIFLCLKHIGVVITTIDRFTESARAITHGNYTRQIETVEYKEFSNLADQFDAMANAIETREIELLEKEEKYRSIFTAAKDAIIIADDKTGQILDVNDYACTLYQYPKEEFLSLSILDISNEPEKTQDALDAGSYWIPERIHIKKDATLFPVEISVSYHLRPDKVSICTVVARDISKRVNQEKDRKQMEKRLSQAQKMEAIGRLAGGIAHDFNNILAAIVGFSELTQTNLPKGSKQTQYIAHVLKAAKRAKELVNQILSFARSARIEKKPVVVSQVLEEVVKFIRASIPASIEIKTVIQSHKSVMADAIQLHQVVMNLCTNAWHAMKKEGGTLTVRLEEICITQPDLKEAPQAIPPGQYLQLAIEDTGTGIDKENLLKIFDPYFTTKGAGEGSGMGLSVVQGIIRDTGGFINVNSTKGLGSTFHICLPVAMTLPQEESLEAASIPKGNERILVVDDEQEIATVIAMILEDLGYQVVPENDPENALKIVKEDRHRFDLVLTDMTMPRLNGENLIKKIFAICPKMPVIICTGFHESMTPEKAREMGIKGFLYKPIERSLLARTIRQVLD